MTNDERDWNENFRTAGVAWRSVNSLFAFAVAIGLAIHSQFLYAETARGVVYHDQNSNGSFDSQEPGIPNVCVSNGREVVRTNADGRYELPVDDDTILFVVKPRNWHTPLNEQRLPRFFYIHKPAGSPDEEFAFEGVDPTGPLPDSVDFPLTPQTESEDFSAVLIGDPQPYTREEVRYYANDVVAELVDSDATFGISLGDIVGDKLSLFEHVNNVQAKVGVPWYNVHGNHDMNFRAPNDRYADETFERVYGPADYAFQWASVHFLILDNVFWKGYTTDDQGRLLKGNYTGALTKKQLDFVKNYVAHVPTDELIVVCTHIPMINSNSAVHGTRGREQLLASLANHPHQVSFSAHTHYTRQDFLGGPDDLNLTNQHTSLEANEKHESNDDQDHHHHQHFQLHHHHNTVTGSGSWFRGPKDEQGFPMTPMKDGVPNGYIIATFSGSEYKLRYKAARMPSDFQMSVHAPAPIPLSQVGSTEILANVFNGNEKSTVRMRVRGSGDWVPMTRSEREDPAYRALYERDQAAADGTRIALPAPAVTPHMWVATLPDQLGLGVHVVEVESKDMFGQIDRGIRLIEVDPDPAPAPSDATPAAEAQK